MSSLKLETRRLFLFLLSALGLAAGCSAQDQEWLRVERVVDGDTLILERLDRVRLLGIDTPESVRPDHPVENFAKQASAFLVSLVDHEQVRVSFGRPRIDEHGRDLVFLFLKDGTFVNAELVRAGLAFLYTRSDNRYRRQFEALEAEARSSGRGLWGLTGRSVTYHGNRSSEVYHAPTCEHYNCRQCTGRFSSIAEAEQEGFRMHRGCVTRFLRDYSP